MKKVVSFSGGRTSAYLCHLMIELYGSENVDFIFMDTGAEHPKTYEFIRNVDREFGLNLVCLRTEFMPMHVGNIPVIVKIDDLKFDLSTYSSLIGKYGEPVLGFGCSRDLKQRIFYKYCNDKYGKGMYETWLGIRADEPNRLTEKKFVSYLAEISDFEKEDVLSWWARMPFDLDIKEHLGNCVFCPKKSSLKLAAAQRDCPAEYMDWIDMIDNADSKMYRGKQSLESLIATFDGSTGDEIKARMRGAKHLDTGSCSESCEVFNDESTEIDEEPKLYDVLYTDPPWRYGSKGPRSGKFADLDYSSMTIGDLCQMDVNSITAKDCALHMWVTGSFMEDAMTVGKAWGFKFVRVDKVWNKKKESGKPHAACGPWGMSDCEFILLFVKGSMCSKQEGKRNQYVSTDEPYTGKHSEKPLLFRDQIDARYQSGLNKLEMFARYPAKNWSVFGDQAPNSITIGTKL